MALEKFHFTTADDIEITVPFYLDAIRRKDYKKLDKLAKEAGGWDELDDDLIFEYARIDENILEKIDEMSMRDLRDFMKGWMEASKTGESSAS